MPTQQHRSQPQRHGCRPRSSLILCRVDEIAAIAATLSCVALAACGSLPDDTAPASETWVGTITTGGNVTTVHNESGSVWGGPGTLVEEASIGVDAGEDAYMLGRVTGLAASEDRIYVVDRQIPILRVYDWSGAWVRDLGHEGEGPGEFRYPMSVGIDPEGRIWVHDQSLRRIVVFSSQGETVATLTLGGALISGAGQTMVVGDDGRGFALDIIRADDASDGELHVVMRPYGLDGEVGDPVELPRFADSPHLEARSSGAVRFLSIPFYANGTAALAPSRALLVGTPDIYRFEVRHPDGRTTAIERSWEPVAVAPEEAAAHEEAATAYMREMDPDWVWDAPPIPTTKPAFTRLLPTASGEIWVLRPGPGRVDPDCDESSFDLDGEAHCWTERRSFDVFGADGRYLGEVGVPDHLELDPQPFIRGNDVIARVEDDSGTIMVKRYRLIAPFP